MIKSEIFLLVEDPAEYTDHSMIVCEKKIKSRLKKIVSTDLHLLYELTDFIKEKISLFLKKESRQTRSC